MLAETLLQDFNKLLLEPHFSIHKIVPHCAQPGNVVKMYGSFPFVTKEDLQEKCPFRIHFPGHSLVRPMDVNQYDVENQICTEISVAVPPAVKGMENDEVQIFLFVEGKMVRGQKPVSFQYRTPVRRVEWVQCTYPLLKMNPQRPKDQFTVTCLSGLTKASDLPRSPYGRTLLHLYALERKDKTLVDLLRTIQSPRLTAQIVNLADNAGYTLLHIAAARGAVDLAKTLLQMRANPHLRCNKGHLPMDLCSHTPLLQKILCLARGLLPHNSSLSRTHSEPPRCMGTLNYVVKL